MVIICQAQPAPTKTVDGGNWGGGWGGAILRIACSRKSEICHFSHGGETRRDRVRRILKKLLNERKETTVAVPVPVPVLPGGHIGGLPAESSFEGSYVAVAGRPGERTVHIVNGRTGVEIAGTGNKFFLHPTPQELPDIEFRFTPPYLPPSPVLLSIKDIVVS